MADFASGFLSGTQAGANIQYAHNQRADRKLEKGSREAQADAAAGAQGIPTQDQAAHASFLSKIGAGLSHLGQGIEGFFNPMGAPGAQAPGALPPGPAAAPPQGVLPSPGMPPGAPAPGGMPYNPAVAQPAPFMPAAPGAQAPATMMATGGVVPPPQQAAPAQPAPQDMGTPPPSIQQTLGAAMPPPAQGVHNPPGGFGNFQVSQVPVQSRSHRDEVDDFATHLFDHSLDDEGAPRNTRGIAASPDQLLQQVAANPAAAQGIPEASPAASQEGSKTKHSLTADFWDDSDQRIGKAVRAAALAGHDPSQVMQSLNTVRTSFVQGHVLRNLSAANVALMNGNNAMVEKALRNVNYYLPDGNDLNIKKVGGQIVYQNPLQPYIDENGQPSDIPSKNENYIPVDAAHLQMLGTAMLDPMKVNDLITSARAAGQKAKLDSAKAYNETLTAQGALATGQAALKNAESTGKKVASTIYKDTSAGALNEAKSKYYGGLIDLKIKQAGGAKDKLAYDAGKDASKAVYDLSQGMLSTIAPMDAAGNPSMAPSAGKPYRDETKIPAEFQLKPEQIHQVAALAGEIGAANRGRIPPEQSAQIAAQVYGGVRKTHPGPDGKPVGNVKISADRTAAWYWNGASWTPFRLSPETGGVLASGRNDILPPESGDEQEAEESSAGDEPSDDDNTPAE